MEIPRKSLENVVAYNIVDEEIHYEEECNVQLPENYTSNDIEHTNHILYDLTIVNEFIKSL